MREKHRKYVPKRKEKKNTHVLPTLGICVLGGVIVVLTVLGFCLPLRPTYSEMELRQLAEFPTPTVETVLNGDFFTDVSLWFSDTFPFREGFVSLANDLEDLYGFGSVKVVGNVDAGDEIPDVPADSSDTTTPEEPSETPDTDDETTGSPDENTDDTEQTEDEDIELPDLDPDAKVETLGVLLVIDDAAYEYYNFTQDEATQYINAINRAGDLLDGTANVYSMVVPSSMAICVPEKVWSGINTSDQKKAIEYLDGSLSDKVTPISVYDTLLKHSAKGEYLYYRTDHHWTADGAWYAYLEFMDTLGRPAADLEKDFTRVEFPGFLGSFYRTLQSSAMENNPDTVVAYKPNATNDIEIHWEDGTQTNYNIITDVSTWASTSKYASCFIGGDNPYSVIENPEITDGSSVLLVKESYGNCFAPYLAASFQYTYIVDYRYYNDVEKGTLVDLVKEKGIDDVLFLNTISTTRSSNLLTLLDGFVG